MRILMRLHRCIDNWDDIVTLFALDRATSDGDEQHEESATAVDIELKDGVHRRLLLEVQTISLRETV